MADDKLHGLAEDTGLVFAVRVGKKETQVKCGLHETAVKLW